tara:strand:- start:29871 stop:31451 length:1581 start_codon:yes stop_codon:yes gene_type:complete
MLATKEQILDRISMLLIENFSHPNVNTSDISEWQQAIVDGNITYNTNDSDEIVLFGSDLVADKEDSDVVNIIFDFMKQNNLSVDSITFDPINLHFYVDNLPLSSINSEVQSITLINNFSQYIDFDQTHKNIDNVKAQEILDTEIFELIPTAVSRQEQINQFFADYEKLKGDVPPYELDNDGDTELDSMTPDTSAEYSGSHDISGVQEQGLDDSNSFITRLDADANENNQGKTLQSLRDNLNEYLKDIDLEAEAQVEDDRPEYENKSAGYLKIRHLNQGLIIRKQEGDDIGIEKLVRIPESSAFGPNYLVNGFTVTMWVKFLDRVNKGTLFNYGNPFRLDRPKGIRLETYVLNKDETLISEPDVTWGSIAPPDFFVDNDYERFVRLVVRDNLNKSETYPKGKMYDSHIGMPGAPYDRFIPEFGYSVTDTVDYKRGYERRLLTNKRVPIDFDEWFFIVASYDPNISDIDTDGFDENPDWWNGNISIASASDPSEPIYTHKSGYGTKCKVEIISKSDLLRARGFKPEEE